MKALLQNILRHDWSLVGEKEPYFGVLSDDCYRQGNITAEAVEAFYQSGVAEIATVRQRCQAHFGTMPQGRVLDFGCGVGRHSFAIADHARCVTGYDISDAMVALAKKRKAEIGCGNINFTGEFPVGPFDWINSYIVFQHIQPREGLVLLDKLIAQASDDAILTIYLPLWREAHLHPPNNPVSIVATTFVRFMSKLHKQTVENLIQMHTYDFSVVMEKLNRAGFMDVFLHYENHAGFHGAWILTKRTATAA